MKVINKTALLTFQIMNKINQTMKPINSKAPLIINVNNHKRAFLFLIKTKTNKLKQRSRKQMGK